MKMPEKPGKAFGLSLIIRELVQDTKPSLTQMLLPKTNPRLIFGARSHEIGDTKTLEFGS